MSLQIAKARIQKAQEENASSLDLSSLSLKYLPAELFQLTQLTKLFLGNNQLNSLPAKLGQLTQLTHLKLIHNGIRSLPAELFQLTQLTSLYLGNNQLSSLPAEFGKLTKLTTLYLNNNSITSLPAELGKLTQLKVLYLNNNRITSLPAGFGKLTQLTELYLTNNHLSSLPAEFGKLTQLISLWLKNNQLTSLPAEFGKLTQLTTLWLQNNQLSSLPAEFGKLAQLSELYLINNQLSSLPTEFGKLTQLTTLHLSGNGIRSLPTELFQLTQLTRLWLKNNHLNSLPAEFGKLIQLTSLDLQNNQLSSLPAEFGKLTQLSILYLNRNSISNLSGEFGKLTQLRSLYFGNNQLSSLPAEFAQLTQLAWLDLYNNQLRSLPTEFGKLTQLTKLDLRDNLLKDLPESIGNFKKLYDLNLEGNDIKNLPAHLIQEGTQAIIEYFKALSHKEPVWKAKMVIIGQGGAGKSSLLDSLLDQPHNPSKLSTHGIDIKGITLPHSDETGVDMELNVWDFGGQEIYHATHQFYLSNHSIYILVWSALVGHEAGKLYKWLETIKSLAPDSPVLVVATNCKARGADLPKEDLKKSFPNIFGFFEVDNTGERPGINKLIDSIKDASASLKYMGADSPQSWILAQKELHTYPEEYISRKKLFNRFRKHGISEINCESLAVYLHGLGEILYFKDEADLKNIIILQPQWVSEHIAKILDSAEVSKNAGFLDRELMEKLWDDVEPHIQQMLLRMMEKFDLSYKTQDNKEISLVVEKLKYEEDISYHERWDHKKEEKEIVFKYELSTIPAGIPTWFIARSHRFTTKIHWRTGVFLEYENGESLALITAHPDEKVVWLRVRGLVPSHFFSLLREQLEFTFKRFPGLAWNPLIPCNGGHCEDGCKQLFEVFDLEKRLGLAKPKTEIECNKSLYDINVINLLYGISGYTMENVVQSIKELSKNVGDVKKEVKELNSTIELNLFKSFQVQQRIMDQTCPNLFTLSAMDKHKVESYQFDLELYCHHPGHIHKVEGAKYRIEVSKDWVKRVAKYYNGTMKVLKFISPFLLPGSTLLFGDDFTKDLKAETQFGQAGLKSVDDIKVDDFKVDSGAENFQFVEGHELRLIRQVLKEKDPQEHWGGLQREISKEGYVLWICPEHIEHYRS